MTSSLAQTSETGGDIFDRINQLNKITYEIAVEERSSRAFQELDQEIPDRLYEASLDYNTKVYSISEGARAAQLVLTDKNGNPKYKDGRVRTMTVIRTKQNSQIDQLLGADGPTF